MYSKKKLNRCLSMNAKTKRFVREMSAKCNKNVKERNPDNESYWENKKKLKKRKQKMMNEGDRLQRGKLKPKRSAKWNNWKKIRKKLKSQEKQKYRGQKKPNNAKKNRSWNKKSFKGKLKPFWNNKSEKLIGRRLKWIRRTKSVVLGLRSRTISGKCNQRWKGLRSNRRSKRWRDVKKCFYRGRRNSLWKKRD